MWMKVPSAELQIASDGSGRVSFVMKGLASDRNNACVSRLCIARYFLELFFGMNSIVCGSYLVNVAVTNVATGEVATYEVTLLFQGFIHPA